MSSTWLAQRAWALCADLVLSSSTTCSKRISSMCRGSPLHGAVYSSESSSANFSDKLNTRSRIEKSASDTFTNNSVLRRLISCALQVCLSRPQADKVQSCRWQSHAGRELPQQERRAATQEPAKRERGRLGPRAGIPKRLRRNCLSTAGPTAKTTPLLRNAQKPRGTSCDPAR